MANATQLQIGTVLVRDSDGARFTVTREAHMGLIQLRTGAGTYTNVDLRDVDALRVENTKGINPTTSRPFKYELTITQVARMELEQWHRINVAAMECELLDGEVLSTTTPLGGGITTISLHTNYKVSKHRIERLSAFTRGARAMV